MNIHAISVGKHLEIYFLYKPISGMCTKLVVVNGREQIQQRLEQEEVTVSEHSQL